MVKPLSLHGTYVDSDHGVREQGTMFFPPIYMYVDKLMAFNVCVVLYTSLRASKTGRKKKKIFLNPSAQVC